MFSILVAEDDYSLRELMSDFLSDNGYQVYRAKDGAEALIQIERSHIDLMICDIMMPELDGYGLTRELREAGFDLPVIMVTARETLEDKHMGFLAGTDDYMVKPFLPKELSLRIGIILRRYYKGEDPIVQLAGSQIDFDRAEVIKENEHFPLTAKEHDILLALYRNAGRIVTIDQLCEAAWGDNPYGYENSLMAHIRRIREKIEANPSKPVSLITVKGLGYKLVLTGK